MALVASLIFAMVAIYAQQMSVDTEKNLRKLRIRSLLTLQENLARLLLNQNRSYICQAGSGTFPRCAPGDKIVIDEFFLKLQVEIPVSGCQKSLTNNYPICGIIIEPGSISYDPVDHSTKIKIAYNGDDTKLNSASNLVEVKLNYLSTSGTSISCSPNRPFLTGISSQAAAQCDAISPKVPVALIGAKISFFECPLGGPITGRWYLEQVNSTVVPRLDPTCRQMDSALLKCPKAPEAYILKYQWDPSNKITPFPISCMDKIDPFLRWPPL